MAGPPSSTVAEPLLAYLRESLGSGEISFREPPNAIGGGFDTAIYGFTLGGAGTEFSRPLILRIFRDGGGAQARFEAAVQNTVANQGYPTPRILLTCEDASVLGGAFAIMPRLDGAPMLDKIMGPMLFRMPRMLAQLHAALHELDPSLVTAAIANTGAPDAVAEGGWASIISETRLDGLTAANNWLTANRPQPASEAICHGDLHPLNVMVSGGEISGVLDWTLARIDDPAWDVGGTVALLSQGPMDIPAPFLPIADLARRRIVRRYLKEYTALRPLDAGVVAYYEATRLLGFLIEVGTVRQARAGVVPAVTKTTAFDSPRVVTAIARRFAAITGVRPSLPATT